MTEQPRDEEAIFLAALAKTSPQERSAFVEKACAGNQKLLQRVRELLDSHDDSVGPLDSPPTGVNATIAQPITEQPGTRIGPYKLLQKIGEGGFGVVYMAEQAANGSAQPSPLVATENRLCIGFMLPNVRPLTNF